MDKCNFIDQKDTSTKIQEVDISGCKHPQKELVELSKLCTNKKMIIYWRGNRLNNLTLASVARDLADQGKISLVQRRVKELGVFEYIAITSK